MGFAAWVPMDIRSHRIHKSSKARKAEEWPMLPKCLIAAVPEARHGELRKIRGFDSLQRDNALAPLQIPHDQVERFMDYIEDRNKKVRNAIKGGKAEVSKPVVVKMTPENLPYVMEKMFGALEEAA